MKFFDGFVCEVDVSGDFAAPEALDYEIIVAVYSYEDYDGSAYVLARKDGKLFEVEGGHCSCYGLEGQWKPSEVSIKYLLPPTSLAMQAHPADIASIRELLRPSA